MYPNYLDRVLWENSTAARLRPGYIGSQREANYYQRKQNECAARGNDYEIFCRACNVTTAHNTAKHIYFYPFRIMTRFAIVLHLCRLDATRYSSHELKKGYKHIALSLLFITSVIFQPLHLLFHCCDQEYNLEEDLSGELQFIDVDAIVMSSQDDDCLICGHAFKVNQLPGEPSIFFARQQAESPASCLSQILADCKFQTGLIPRAPPFAWFF